MKKLALLVLLSLCLVSTVYRMENEPEGFGGIRGTNLNTLNDMQLVQEKGAIGLYLRLNDKASIEKEEPRRADSFTRIDLQQSGFPLMELLLSTI